MEVHEIINMGKGNANWQDLKNSNPEEYFRLSHDAVLRKFELVVPLFTKWQQRFGELSEYEKNLPPIEDVLRSLDLSIYDNGLEGKRELTRIFYYNCIPYGVKNVVSLLHKFDIQQAFKIRNLINRSLSIYYAKRCEIVQNIRKILGIDNDAIEKISLLQYFPFLNINIGIEWLKRRVNPSYSELLNDWLVLLCFDKNNFISNEFISELTKLLGEESTERLLKRMLIRIARLNKISSVYSKVVKKYHNKINQYRKYLSDGEIIEDISFGELNFSKHNVKFHNYICPLNVRLKDKEIKYIKSIIDNNRPLCIFVNQISQNGNCYFRPIFKMDMDYLLQTIKKARLENPIIIANDIEIKTSKTRNHNSKSNSVHAISAGRYIAQNVKASEFYIKESLIEFRHNGNSYFFRSSRIDKNVSKSVLEKINHNFSLVKDKSIRLGKNTIRTFYFEPANDFSFLLAEINRLSNLISVKEDDKFPIEGEFEIPWKYVRFDDNILTIIHPNPSKRGTMTPFYFRNQDILKSFEDIRPYIETRCCKLRVLSVDGVITSLLNYDDFIRYVAQYKDWEKAENIGYNDPIKRTNKVNINVQELLRIKEVNKSPYLRHLSYIHLKEYNVTYLLERVIHESGLVDTDEYGYLFVIKKTPKEMVLHYENISNLSRSSILFYTDPLMYEDSVNVIRKFLASDIRNKRQKMSLGKIRFNTHCIKSYKRIKHTDIEDWKSYLRWYI